MKHFINSLVMAAFIVTTIMLALAGCHSNIVEHHDEDDPAYLKNSKTTLSISYPDSETKTKSEPLPEPKPKPKVIHWEVIKFIDEFDEYTGNSGIRSKQSMGRFSNSATAGANFGFNITINQYHAAFNIWDYGQYPASFSRGEMIAKNKAGEILELTIYGLWSQNMGQMVDAKMLSNFLKKSIGVVKFVIKDNYSSVYKFSVDSTGFTKAYNQAFSGK